MATPVDTAALTAIDRCDRCGGQAYVVAQMEAGNLLFCAHHATKHEDAIAAHIVLDERDKLQQEVVGT